MMGPVEFGAGISARHDPAASQAATASRSSRVISVRLLGGIAWVMTAWMRMASACRAISSGVSRRTPFGAVTIPSQTGSAAWHIEQRDWIARTASSKEARPQGCGSRSLDRSRVARLADDREPDRRGQMQSAGDEPRPPRASPCRHAAN